VESGTGTETQIVLLHRRATEEFAGESTARPGRNGIDRTGESALLHFLKQAELTVDFGGAPGHTHGFRVARDTGVFFDENGRDAEFSKQHSGHETTWTSSDNDDLRVFLFHKNWTALVRGGISAQLGLVAIRFLQLTKPMKPLPMPSSSVED
jgi:hypothetical protein